LVRFGVVSWVWVYPFDTGFISRAKEIGFDGVEIPVEDPRYIDVKRVREELNSNGIECSSLCAVLSPDRDAKSVDETVRRNAIGYIKKCIDLAVELGTDIVAGPLYSSVGPTLEVPDKESEWRRSVYSVRDMAEYAEDRGVYLCVEPINRFENHLVNTVDEALKFIEEVDSPNVKMHFDTFHANIEEKSIRDSLMKCGETLYHFHACENDRGAPGSGHIPWREVAEALKSIGYDRYMVIETFQPGIKEIAAAAAIWRPLAPSQDSLARDGLNFLKRLMR